MCCFYKKDGGNVEWILTALEWIVKICARLFKNKYIWMPEKPIINTDVVKDISEFPKGIGWDVNSHDISLGELVRGEEHFVQCLQMFVMTERNKYPIYSGDYGIEEAKSIFEEKNAVEFKRQCNNIANHLIEYFKEWIQEVYQISRKQNTLFIELKVKGKPESLICSVPRIHTDKQVDEV